MMQYLVWLQAWSQGGQSDLPKKGQLWFASWITGLQSCLLLAKLKLLLEAQVLLISLQALKFGNDKEACLKAIDIGFELAPRPNNNIYKGALKTLQMVESRSVWVLRFKIVTSSSKKLHQEFAFVQLTHTKSPTIFFFLKCWLNFWSCKNVVSSGLP